MALAPTNPDMMEVARKAHILSTQEDGYAALDEFRAMTHYSIEQLKFFYRRYVNIVNPRKAPTLFGVTLTQFADTFNSKPDDPKMTQFYKRFKKQNGVADVLEIFAGFCVISDANVEDKVQFLFSIFDFAAKGDVTEDEATMAMECVCSSFVKLGLIVMPTDDELEFCSGWLFTKEDGTGTKEYVSLEEFRAWADTEPASLELLETLNCVPIVESIIEYIENKTKEVHDQFEQFSSIKDNKEENDDDDEEENLLADMSNYERPYAYMSSFKFKESCKILVGPVIGKVTHNSAIVLLETDRKTTIGIQVCIAGGFGADDVPLAPEPPDSLGFGPERAGIQRERLIRTVTLKMRANRPRSIKIDKLTENTTYRIILTGISPDDAIKRTGSFRTFVKCEGDGAGLLLETKGYSKRYHLGSYDDSLTYGGIGIGDLFQGLTAIAVSGDAQIEMDEIGLETQNKNAAKSEPCLWKRLWETCVRPARLDVILHLGNQVGVKAAARKAYDILRHYLSTISPPCRIPPEEEKLQEEQYGKTNKNKKKRRKNNMTKNEGKKEGSKTTESKHGKTRLSYLDVDKDWFRPANRGDIKKIKEQIMELFRDVYRQSWNLPYKREVLAHTSNLMNFGASDLAIDEYIQESKHGPLISKCARIAFWEYQRQLHDADCARGITEALERMDGDSILIETKEEKKDRESRTPRTIPTHEAHFHQFGRIGVLFLDLYSSRAMETGEFNPHANVFNSKQVEMITNTLKIENLNGMLVCVDTNYTGRIISGVEAEEHVTSTGVDLWSLHEKSFIQIIHMLYGWNVKKDGRNIQILAGSNGIGPSGQGLFEDPNTRRVLHQVVVGPMNGPTLNLPPTGDPRCPRHGHPPAKRILSRTAIGGTPNDKIPSIDWIEPQMWDRRNYLIFRMFCGLKREKKFHHGTGATMDLKKEQHVGARAQITYEYSHGPNPKVILGPVIGVVTSTTAIIMLEIDRSGPVTCVVMNVTTSERRLQTMHFPKNKPLSFHINDLKPGTRYSIRFDGVSNAVDRRGGFTTLNENPTNFRFLAGSADSPSLTMKSRIGTWESIWKDQICKQWSGADGMIRLGGQIDLRKLASRLNTLLESYHRDFELLHAYKLATRDGTGLFRRDTDENRACVALARGPLWDSAGSGNTMTSDKGKLSDPIHEIVQNMKHVEDQIEETFRKAYRDAWNRPYIKEVLAHCPQYMVLGGCDLCSSVNEKLYTPILLRISRKIYRQYQRQLWDIEVANDTEEGFNPKDEKLSSELDKRGFFNGHEARFHRFGTTCLILMDTWSNRITVDGRFHPDKPLISTDQWKFLKDLFQWNEDLESLIVCMDMPFTGRTPAEVEEVASLHERTWKNDEWSCRDDEFVRLLDTFFKWRSAKSNRDVQFVTGTSFIAAAGESLLRDINTGKTIRQVAFGPLTGIAHGGLPEKEVSFGPDGQYIRVPMYRTFYRNYGVVKVEKDENRKPGTKTPSNLFETSIITEDSIKVGDFDKPVEKDKENDRIANWWRDVIPFDCDRSWRGLILHRAEKLMRWLNRTFTNSLHESDITGNELVLAYRKHYIQEEKLADSAFYDDVCDMIASGGFDDENKTHDILEKMEKVSNDLTEEGQFIEIKRANTKKMHDSIVGFHRQEYDQVGLIEREKREMFYDARSRLNRLKRGIERAAARAGYTRRKGGITAMREELVDNKDQVEHRNARRARRLAVFTEKRGAIVMKKNYADDVVMRPPPRRRKIVHVDDVEDQGNESANAVKILAEYDFKLKSIFKQENAIELKRGKINSVMVAEDINTTMRIVQEWFEEKLEVLDGEENDEVREHNSIITRLTERINLLESIDTECKGLEDNMVGAEIDVKRCRNELDDSIEVCMEKKKILTEAKAARFGELKAIDRQLEQLNYEIELGNLRPIVERMTHVMQNIWSKPGVIKAEITEVLPVLDDTYLLNVIMKSAFSSTTRDPMNFSTFVDLISSILQEALVFKTAAISPYGVIQLDSKLDSNFDEAGVRLPSGWTRHYDDDKKMEYYHNAETGVTTYVRPAD